MTDPPTLESLESRIEDLEDVLTVLQGQFGKLLKLFGELQMRVLEMRGSQNL